MKVKSYPFLKYYVRKKDGKQQLMIRTKKGNEVLGKTKYDSIIDIPLLLSNGSKVLLTKGEFNNIKKYRGLMQRYYDIEVKIYNAINFLYKNKIEITAKSLFKKVYEEPKKDSIDDKMIFDDEVKKIFDHPVPNDVMKELTSQVFLEEDGHPVSFEDLLDIANSVESDYNTKKRIDEIEKMDYLDRYEKGYFNKNNIFECFGFCLSRNPKKKDEILVADSYKSLLVRLNDFRFNEKPSEDVRDFNDQWIDEFLKFLAGNGYSTFRPRSHNPFTYEKYQIKFIEYPRKAYSYQGFEKIVKHLKRYIFLLQKYKIISYNRNPKFIEAKDYVNRRVNKTAYTRREHSLNVNEFDTLCKADFKDEELNLAKDMFVIAVLGGGFRGEELYKSNIVVELKDGNYLLHIYYPKTKTINTNPVIGALHDVIKKHHGKIPKLLPIEDYRKALKIIAQKLNFDRVVLCPDTSLEGKNNIKKCIIKDIFNPYFARKTCVSYLYNMGLTDEVIIEFTSHQKTDTLRHYKSKLTVESKMKILKGINNN